MEARVDRQARGGEAPSSSILRATPCMGLSIMASRMCVFSVYCIVAND